MTGNHAESMEKVACGPEIRQSLQCVDQDPPGEIGQTFFYYGPQAAGVPDRGKEDYRRNADRHQDDVIGTNQVADSHGDAS